MARKAADKVQANFWRNMVKEIGDVDTNIVEDGLHSSEFTSYIDTGSYILNGELSGSLYGGVPNNKIIGFAGEEATGKTFFVLGVLKQWMQDNPEGGVFYYDTESAVTKGMMKDRGLDTARIVIVEKSTVEDFRTHAYAMLEKYLQVPKDQRPPIILVLDSLGQLSTKKEMEDIKTANDKRDMTRAPMLKGAFRALSLIMAKANCAMLVTNHIYAVIGAYMPTKEMGGGSGLKYAASTIIFLSKKKDRDEKDKKQVIGNIIHCKAVKNRFAKENKQVDVKLSYDKGLDRYYGLIELGEKYGVIKKEGISYILPDGTKAKMKVVNANLEKYLNNPTTMAALEIAAGREFKYGQQGIDEPSLVEGPEDDTSEDSSEDA